MPIASLVPTGAMIPQHLMKDRSMIKAGKYWHEILASLAEHTQYYGTALACVANGDNEAFVRWVEHRAVVKRMGTSYLEKVHLESELAIRKHYSNLINSEKEPPILASLNCHSQTLNIQLDPKCFLASLKNQQKAGLGMHCPVVGCNSNFSRLEEATAHIETHKKAGVWVCPICEEEHDSFLNLWAHAVDLHRNQGSIRCAFCNAAFISRDRLIAHNIRVHEAEGKELEGRIPLSTVDGESK